MPITLQAFENPTPADYLDDPDHAGQHADVNDAVEELQAVLSGVDAPTGAGQFLISTSAGVSVFAPTASTALTDIDSDPPTVGDVRQWDGASWVSVSVPLVTNLVWEGDDPIDSSFLDPN